MTTGVLVYRYSESKLAGGRSAGSWATVHTRRDAGDSIAECGRQLRWISAKKVRCERRFFTPSATPSRSTASLRSRGATT